MTDKSEHRVELEGELKSLFGGRIPETIATLISELKDDQLALFIRRAAESRYPLQTDISDPTQGSGSWKRAVFNKYVYLLAGLASGLICIIGGIMLIVHNMMSSVSWIGNVVRIESQNPDAAAGAILFLVGLVLVSITFWTVRLNRRNFL